MKELNLQERKHMNKALDTNIMPHINHYIDWFVGTLFVKHMSYNSRAISVVWAK